MTDTHSDSTSKHTVSEPLEITGSDSKRVHCDGGLGSLGHPRIYLEMGEKDFVDCPYCGKRFVYTNAH